MSSTEMRQWRRRRAWDLKQQGWKQRETAHALGVSEGAVSQWLKRARTRGVEALTAKPRKGAPSKLTQEQKEEVRRLLSIGAEANGYPGQVWTTSRVADLIQQHLGVRYHPATMSDLLRELGWSQQKPIERARQRKVRASYSIRNGPRFTLSRISSNSLAGTYSTHQVTPASANDFIKARSCSQSSERLRPPSLISYGFALCCSLLWLSMNVLSARTSSGVHSLKSPGSCCL